MSQLVEALEKTKDLLLLLLLHLPQRNWPHHLKFKTLRSTMGNNLTTIRLSTVEFLSQWLCHSLSNLKTLICSAQSFLLRFTIPTRWSPPVSLSKTGLGTYSKQFKAIHRSFSRLKRLEIKKLSVIRTDFGPGCSPAVHGETMYVINRLLLLLLLYISS